MRELKCIVNFLENNIMFTSDTQSVTAFLMFLTISSGLSVKHILLFGSGSDFAIFLIGSLRLLNLANSKPGNAI